MKRPRYKVWTREDDPVGRPKTLLLRTGLKGTEPDWFDDTDVTFAGETAAEVAAFARARSGVKGDLMVRNFDTGVWHVVDDAGVATELTGEGWRP